jgi:hypothetical protein
VRWRNVAGGHDDYKEGRGEEVMREALKKLMMIHLRIYA